MRERFFKVGNKVNYRGGLGVRNLGVQLKHDLNALTVLPYEVNEDIMNVVSIYYYAILENDIKCFESVLETRTIDIDGEKKEITVTSDLQEREPYTYFVKDIMIPELIKAGKENMVKICEDFLNRK